MARMDSSSRRIYLLAALTNSSERSCRFCRSGACIRTEGGEETLHANLGLPKQLPAAAPSGLAAVI
ncbi:hypothetical protein GGD54_006079 [Rhizobium tropici]|uniref:Uncharacterized protein n=2 Tax=Rhizobium TaxID=379 RepID=A0A1C3XHA6_9HYPH|nr:hypothetical protein [Rhizobium tropici]MBB6305438.1 hypothetical protein [Rhizobium leucaenae]MBB6488526.1 hypothetical protein [Rhizobium lusitanum]MBB5596626.1 hypothetical protein [Rhizobium tropici]MBB6495602.1 hypothetical protein [Rhizobium tropici]